MYSDPSRIRRHIVKIRFSDEEAALVEAFVNYTGEQKASLLRELILTEAVAALGLNDEAMPALKAAP